MDTLLLTPRLTLLRLTDTSSPTSPHVRLFHENWSNPDATGWSLHGSTHTLAESYEWMKEQLGPEIDNMFYSVFVRPRESEKKGGNAGLGEHVGSVSLRLQKTGPTLPFPYSPSGLAMSATTTTTTTTTTTLPVRVLGYAFFPSARGKGYATEAGHALLNAYAAFVSSSPSTSSSLSHKDHGEDHGEEEERAKWKTYIEAAVDEDNPGSIKVLTKFGFKKLGWKYEEDKVWLNGAWRGPGYWVYGLFVQA